MRYEGEIVWRFKGDRPLALQYRQLGRLLLGELLSTLAPGVETLAKEYRRDNGLRVRVQLISGSTPIVEIDVSGLEANQVLSGVQLWIPEGFVIYPASDASPNGWGLPINYISDSTLPPELQEFAPDNLRPGLDVARWTPGGLLGQVLLSQAQNAGYPDPIVRRAGVVITPHYHPQFGPVPTSAARPASTPWQAYRLEFADYTAQALGLDTEARAALVGWKRETFERINVYREGLGRDRIYPQFRGVFDISQACAEMAWATGWSGHMVEAYPITYRTYNDRGGKNGSASEEANCYVSTLTMAESAFWYSGEILVTFAQSLVPGYNDANGWPVNQIVGLRFDITPEQALDAWAASPRHSAYLSSTSWDLGEHQSCASTMSLGYRQGTAVALFSHEGQWIQCGNRFWHSRHSEVPALSWRGFETENLLWETWPVKFTMLREGADPAYTYRTRIDVQAPFIAESTVSAEPGGASYSAAFSNQFLYGIATDYTDAPAGVTRRNVLGGEIFARGRAIAIAPDMGFVLSAGVHRIGAGEGATYRLIAICHHEEDQTGDPVVDGMTRFLRVWWADMVPDDPLLADRDGGIASLRCHPRTLIRKKFGEEDAQDDGPWTELNGVNNWHGGQLIDVGTTGQFSVPDLLKYDCLWRFNAEGTKSICIRSSFDPAWFESRASWDDADPGFVPAMFSPTSARFLFPAHSDSRSMLRTPFGPSYASFAYCEGGEPWFLELDFQHGEGSMTASLSMLPHGSGAGGRAEEGGWWFETVLATCYGKWQASADANPSFSAPIHFRPIVAYFADDGSARALYDVTSSVFQQFAFDLAEPVGPLTRWWVSYDRGLQFRGLVQGPGPITVEQCRSLLPDVRRYSSELALAAEDFMASHPAVFFVDDEHVAYAAAGCAPQARTSEPSDFNPFIERRAYALALDNLIPWTAAITAEFNPAWPGYCGIAPTEALIWRYAAWVNGERVHYAAAANPQPDYLHAALTTYYGVLPGPILGTVWEGGPWTIGWVNQRLAGAHWQGGFAKDRRGEWVFGASLCRQPAGNLRRSRDDSPIPSNPAVNQWINDCGGGTASYFLHQNLMASFSHAGRPENFGGFMVASFADQSQLATLTGTPGEAPRTLYARVV